MSLKEAYWAICCQISSSVTIHPIPEAKALASDETHSIRYEPWEQDAAIEELSDRLARISKWGEKRQVSFAPKKTQLRLVERTSSAIQIKSQLEK